MHLSPPLPSLSWTGLATAILLSLLAQLHTQIHSFGALASPTSHRTTVQTGLLQHQEPQISSPGSSARFNQLASALHKNDLTKRGIDFGLGRGYSGNQAAKHYMGLAASNFAGGPGKRKRSSIAPVARLWQSRYQPSEDEEAEVVEEAEPSETIDPRRQAYIEELNEFLTRYYNQK